MPRKPEYRQPRVFTTKFEREIIDRYQELMRLQGKNVNDGLQEHMQEYIKLYGDDAQGILDQWLHDPQFILSHNFNSEEAIIRKLLEACSHNQLESILDQLDIWQQLVDKVKLDRRVKKVKEQYEKPIVLPPETRKMIDDVFDEASK
jgi:hypothetical protein